MTLKCYRVDRSVLRRIFGHEQMDGSEVFLRDEKSLEFQFSPLIISSSEFLDAVLPEPQKDHDGDDEGNDENEHEK